MSKTIISKTCSTCKYIKPLGEFYKREDAKDGHYSQCKICHIQSCRKYQLTEQGKVISHKTMSKWECSRKGREWRQNYHSVHPERRKSRHAVENAIKFGNLAKPKTLTCIYCGQQAEEYHHYLGYEREHSVDVLPVCENCHKQLRH